MLMAALRRWESEVSSSPPSGGDEASWREAIADQLTPVRALIAETVARVKGPDWPELAWDSYQYRAWLRQHWLVQTPLAALAHTAEPLVPVIAGGSILGPPLSRAYRRYWGSSKGYLALVAEIAVRFPAEGRHLAGELLARLPRLPRSEHDAVQLHLAVLGLLDEDPVVLAQSLLRQAAGDELGGRGELLLQALDGIRELPEAARRGLLAQAALVAQRTTAFVASNPYAAVLEAMSAASLGGVGDLAELLDRAVELKIRDWLGWDRALDACGRALTGLVRRQGETMARWALQRLDGYTFDFPALGAELRLAAARALPRDEALAWAGEALDVARRLKPSRSALRAEVTAAAWLARQSPETGLDELRLTCGRVLRRRWGGGRDAALRLAAVAFADLDAGDGARVAEALELQQAIRGAASRWLAAVGVATAPDIAPAVAAQELEFATRAMRWRPLSPPPLGVLVPLVSRLATALPGGLRHRLAQRLGRATVEAAEGRCSGPELAAFWMSAGSSATSPEALSALAALADDPSFGWWRLPLLAILADSLAARADLLARSRSGTLRPDEEPDAAPSAVGDA